MYTQSVKGMVDIQIKNYLFLFQSLLNYDWHETSISYFYKACFEIKYIIFLHEKVLLKKIMLKKIIFKMLYASSN